MNLPPTQIEEVKNEQIVENFVDQGFGLSKDLYLGDFTETETKKMRDVIKQLFTLIKNGK